MSSGDSAWFWATVLSLLFLLTGEIYGAYDTEWVYQRFFAVFLTLQYIEVALSFVIFRGLGGVSGKSDTGLLISHYINALCFLVGFKASFITAYTLGECQRLDSHTVDRARSCIDVYSNFASIDGPRGFSTACASLDVSVESYMGGVCPNVNQTHGTALLVVQMVFTMLLTVFNIGKFTVTYSALTENRGEVPEYTTQAPPATNKRSVHALGSRGERRQAVCYIPNR